MHKVLSTQGAQEVGSSSCYHPRSLDFSSLNGQVTWPHRRADCREAREIGVHPTSQGAVRDKDSALNLCRITQRLLLQKLRVQWKQRLRQWPQTHKSHSRASAFWRCSWERATGFHEWLPEITLGIAGCCAGVGRTKPPTLQRTIGWSS